MTLAITSDWIRFHKLPLWRKGLQTVLPNGKNICVFVRCFLCLHDYQMITISWVANCHHDFTDDFLPKVHLTMGCQTPSLIKTWIAACSDKGQLAISKKMCTKDQGIGWWVIKHLSTTFKIKTKGWYHQSSVNHKILCREGRIMRLIKYIIPQMLISLPRRCF